MAVVRNAALAAAVALAAAGTAAAQPDGMALFAQHCASCHQTDGSGTVGLAPPLKGEHWQRLGADRGYLLEVLLRGLSGPIRVGAQTFVGAMPGVPQLDDTALAALANHVRMLQGEPAAGYGADEVKAARGQAGSPPQTRQRRQRALGG
ncbi:MAG: c-type cytochrome [Aquabacterium sp.]